MEHLLHKNDYFTSPQYSTAFIFSVISLHSDLLIAFTIEVNQVLGALKSKGDYVIFENVIT